MKRFHYLKNPVLKLTLVFIFSSCLTPIDIKTDNIGGTLVISGQVSSLSGRSKIQIGTLSSDRRLPNPFRDALVKLFDGDGNIFFFSENLIPGTYESTFSGIPGKTYYIEVTTPNGSIYKSNPEVIPLSVGTIATSFTINEEEFIDSEGTISHQNFFKVLTRSTIQDPRNTYLHWTVEETFLLSPTDFPDPFGSIPPPCFISQNADPQRVTLYNGSEFPTNEIQEQIVASRIIDWSFLERHYFTTYQTSLTSDAYEYWRKVDILANQVGSIFDTPPAKIMGNITCTTNPSEEVLGYFQGVNETYDRFFTLPFLLPIDLFDIKKCDFTGSFNQLSYPTRCITCLSVRNSSYARPDWF